MTPSELIDALHRSGATLVLDGDKARMTGAEVSPELKMAIKANREAVIREWRRREAQSPDRYAIVPSGAVPMCGEEMALLAAERATVMAHVFRQPRPVHAWVMCRANEYFKKGLKPEDCEWRGCVDLIAWQRACGGLEAVRFVVGAAEK